MSDDNLGAKLHSTMDARIWAQAFMETLERNAGKPPEWLDEGLMISWFANALMCGWDTAHQRKFPDSLSKSAKETK